MNGNTDVVGSIIFGNQTPTWKMTMPKLTPDLEEKLSGYVGIDPGATGAIALLDENGGFLSVNDYPASPSGLWSLLQCFRNVRVKLAVLEQVHSMPKQGVASSFKFGSNFGIWQMACAAMKWPTELITPQRWRKVLDSTVPPKPTKDDIRNYAIRRWPSAAEFLKRKKDEGRGEALCIASYARLKSLGQVV